MDAARRRGQMGFWIPERPVPPSLDPRRVSVATVFAALAGGWRAFRRFPASAAGFAAVFALIGVASSRCCCTSAWRR
jgi:hypothetical protein